jgi:hypothetical protein
VTLRLAYLFLRSRRVFPALAGVLLCAVGGGLVGRRWTGHADVALLTSVLVPLAAATLIGATVASPFGELEQSLSKPLAPVRLGQLLGLLVLTTIAILGAAATWHDPALGRQCVRNLLGLTGMGLLAAQLAGGRWAWTAPVGFCGLALVLRGALGELAPRWAWVVQPASRTSSLLALGFLFGGLLLAVRRGVRPVDAERVG